MSSSVTCRECGARLKVPPQTTRKSAKCPRCRARVDLQAALEASAYLPTLASTPAFPVTKPSDEREEDPLPYTNLNPLAPAPPSSPERPTRPHKPLAPPPVPASPSSDEAVPETPTSAPVEFIGTDEAPLSLDDDPSASPPPPAGPPPFRVPVQVAADSSNLFNGPCEAVFVMHGLFLETIPFRPFLYLPCPCAVEQTGGRSLQVAIPDGRVLTLVFTSPNGRAIAADAAAFLAGEGSIPDPAAYRRTPPWLLGAAIVLALGLASGPLVLSQTANLGLDMGVKLGAAFTVVGLLANLAVAGLTRLSIVARMATMGAASVLVTSVFFLTAFAYLAGRKDAAAAMESPPAGEVKSADPPAAPPLTPALPPPTTLDAAYRDGLYRFEDGPDDVTALGVSPDSSILLIGHKNGTTRVWRFEKSTIDPSDFDPGPRCDGPPARIQFDAAGSIVYLAGTGGTVAAMWNSPPESPAKIPGDLIAVGGDRFAAVRGNVLTIRMTPAAAIKKPTFTPKKGAPATRPNFIATTAADETIPADAKAPLRLPSDRLTFLAWHPSGKLLGGAADGSILSWGATGPASTVATREHKGAVRAWAASTAGDFATGDDKGVIGVWMKKAMTPRTFIASASTGITQLSFSPSAAHLMARDAEGTISVWDLAETRAILKVRRPASRAIAYGPKEDLVLFSVGKAVELWHVPQLDRRP